jgi:hypothetical protein
MVTMQMYEEAIRSRVCAQCIERTGRGVCGTDAWDECALNRHLPEIVEIVRTLGSDSLHDYVHELHNVVCVSCKDNLDGRCSLREHQTCALDQYFPLVVQAVREVHERANASTP